MSYTPPTDHVGAQEAPRPSATVMPFRPREPRDESSSAATPTTAVATTLQHSLQAQALALEVLAVDQTLSRVPGDVLFEDLKPEIADLFLDRAAIAVNLGDPLKRSTADEKAAIAVLRGIEAGIKAGAIKAESPLTCLDLSSVRVVAKLALAGALEYLAARERRR